MPKKAKKAKKAQKDESSNGLWIAPRSNLKGPTGERAWDDRLGGPPNSGKFLELADIALGSKKPAAKKPGPVAGTHVIFKNEPYSR
jgi:hypothetical protein